MVSILALAIIDWHVALASLVTVPFSLICMILTFQISGKNFDKYNYSNAYMNSTIVEYIEGIEVIKADRGQTDGVRGVYLPAGPQGGRTERVLDARLDLSAECVKCNESYIKFVARVSRIIYKIHDTTSILTYGEKNGG